MTRPPDKTLLFSVERNGAPVPVWQTADGRAVFFRAGLSVDADGAPNACHLPPHEHLGLDDVSNAGRDGYWWGLVTDASGKPHVQAKGRFAGYCVSTTALCDRTKPATDPYRYVDASEVPYIVLPGHYDWPAQLGDLAAVYNARTRRLAYAIYADVGPHDAVGEGSIRLADELGTYRPGEPRDARRGGTSIACVLYVVFPGSRHRPAWPVSIEAIRAEGARLFLTWGGMRQLDVCFPGIV